MKTHALLLPFLCLLLCPSSLAAAPPNMVFIYADDWGWGDLGCHGHPHLRTPNLDRLAREGADFHQFTVGNPVCSPSRAAILTGQYPARHGVHQHFASHEENLARGMPDWLDPRAPLLPRMLKEAGYATGHFGKWHLSGGGRDIGAPLPAEYGYDTAAVWTGPGRSVFEDTPYLNMAGDAHGGTSASFLTTAATEHALRFIRASAGRPFYVNLWLHETHHLVSATSEDKKAYPDTPEPQRTYYAAVTRADKQVGRVLDILDELGLANDTLVIFSSDNGPENSMPERGDKFYFSVGETGGLRGRKRSLYLGGVNVPFLVRWPGVVPAGRVDKTSVITGVDVLPTLLAAAGVKAPKDYEGDGEDIRAALEGRDFQRARPVFWEWRGPHSKEADWPTHAVRSGNHVLLHDEKLERVELYDVVADRAQQRNLAEQMPDKVSELRALLEEWRAGLPPFQQSPGRTRAATPAAKKITSQDRSVAFKRWDKDADGFLTLQEYTDGLAKKDDAPKRFQNFDKNADGRVSLEEFTRP